jgi:putative colanic acid biosynthesis acetyltransferase WcaF
LVQVTLWRVPRAWGLRRWLLRRFGARVGAHAIFKASTRIYHPWLFAVGAHTTLSPGVVIYNLGAVSIGEHTVLSQDTYVCAGTHDYTRPDLPLLRQPIVIGNGVWIAAAAFIGPGVTIGNNAVIGARSVVVGDVPPGVVSAGHPARVLKTRPMNPGSEAAGGGGLVEGKPAAPSQASRIEH